MRANTKKGVGSVTNKVSVKISSRPGRNFSQAINCDTFHGDTFHGDTFGSNISGTITI